MKLLWATLLLSLPTVALAETCHTLKGPGTDDVASLVLRDEQDLFFTRPGAPYLVFEFGCSIRGADTADCPVVCDGGSLQMERDGEDILVSARVRIEQLRMDTITAGLTMFEVDGTHLDGEFRLRPASQAECDAVPAGQPFTLQPGDYLPVVTQVEQSLVEGGYFDEMPDAYYTRATADAVERFQADLGLVQTGKMDRATIGRLASFVSYVTGGC